MSDANQYCTISKRCSGEYTLKGSKFIAFAFPVENEMDILQHLSETKALHPKARHWCYAWKLINNEPESKSSDDGEPAGTAGKPILNQINSKGLNNILLIVVRYFGGILLGTSGLIKAYKTSVQNCLESADQIEVYIENEYNVISTMEKIQILMSTLKELNIKVLAFELNSPAQLRFSIPANDEIRLFGFIKSRLEKKNRDQLGDPFLWEGCNIERCESK